MPEFALDIIPCLIRRHTCRWSNWNKKLMRWEILNQHTQYISVALFLSVAGKSKTKSQQKMAPTSHPPRCQVKDPKSTENGPNKWSTWLKLVMIVCVCVCVCVCFLFRDNLILHYYFRQKEIFKPNELFTCNNCCYGYSFYMCQNSGYGA